MRDPQALNTVTVTNDETEILKIDNLPVYEIEDYDLFDEKDFRKYILDIKNECRNSYEYREFINYLRDNLDMNKCSVYENVSNIDNTKIKIHIHHDPFGLEDICRIVVNKRQQNNELMDVEQVAKEVMFLHYKLMVGLVPLAETPHELVHNNYLFIPTDHVIGYYKEFVNLYEPYIEPDQLYVLDSILEMTKTYRHEELNVLNKKYIYIDATGEYDLPPLEAIRNIMYDKMNNIEKEVDIFNHSANLPHAMEYIK